MLNKNNSIVSLGNIRYMSNVFDKIERENSLNIVYLGGSITQGCNADSEENRYVNLSAKWWNEMFPHAVVSFFNAGIGATTSQFGAARAPYHVLDKKPDLVFVEFSVNDKNTPEFMKSYESLIRRLLKHDSVKAVVIINNLYYDDGSNAQGIHNNIAMHYGLPAVSVRDYIYPEILLGNIDRELYTDDMLHPKNIGHKMIADLIKNFLDIEYEYYKKIGTVGEKPALPSPFTSAPLENSAWLQNYNSSPVLNGFSKDTHKEELFRIPFKNGWLANDKGASITFEVESSLIFAQFKKTINHPAPIAKAVIDGNENNAVILDANFEETWGDLCALEKIFEGENKKHTVTVTITETGTTEFMLISLITG